MRKLELPDIETIIAYVSSPETLFQVMIIALAMAVTRLGVLYCQRKVFRLVGSMSAEGGSKQVKQRVLRFMTRYLAPLVSPLVLIVLLALSVQVAGVWVDKPQLIVVVNKLVAVWLLLRMIRVLVVGAPVRAILLMVLVPAAILQVFGLLEHTLNYLHDFGFDIGKLRISVLSVLKAMVVGSLLWWAVHAISTMMESYIGKQKELTSNTRELLIKSIDIILYFILLMVVLNMLGIDLTGLSIFGGALGVGLGFGLQNIASNFISGIIILFEKNIRVGDLVELGQGFDGIVKKLGARAAIIQMANGRDLLVPNSDLISKQVITLTFQDNRARVDIPVLVSYGSDLQQAQTLLLEAARENPLCLKDPAPNCFLKEFSPNGALFVLWFWIADVTEGKLRPQSDVMFAIWKKFLANNISMAELPKLVVS